MDSTDPSNLLVVPNPQFVTKSQLSIFIRHCEQHAGSRFADYTAFEQFAVNNFRKFWSLFLQWSGILYEGDDEVSCLGDACESAVFFPNVRLNYVETLLRDVIPGKGLIAVSTDGRYQVLSRQELRRQVIALAAFLQRLGVEPGDRVGAIARNNAEVIVAALASAAIGAVFSSCAHDMGSFMAQSRFEQLELKLLFANCASQPWDVGKPQAERVGDLVASLPSLIGVITLDAIRPCVRVPVYSFADVLSDSPGDFDWRRFPFNHPLFIMFSSGTTGAPKCIIHGAGGTLLEHMKEHQLHGNLDCNDRMFFQTSCGWMMWNWQLSALACGAEVMVYDGPLQGPETFWQLVSAHRVTVFGTSPAYIQFAKTAGYFPQKLDFSALRGVLSTGSILYPKEFDWVIEHVKRVPVQSISGGTDILGCFVLGNPLLPVYRGQAQCRSLGLDVRSLPPSSRVGELVCVNPFPSRPLGFYGVRTGGSFHDAYFAENPGVWTHGDLIEFTSHGAIMHGRSDDILNIRGVRVGPVEIYHILRQIPAIVEAMAVEQTDQNELGGSRLILLVVLQSGLKLDLELMTRIRRTLAEHGSVFMVPAVIVQVMELPVTHNGKRSAAAARDAVNGCPIRNLFTLSNPNCLNGLLHKVLAGMPAARTVTQVDVDSDDLEHSLCEICRCCLNIPVVQPFENYLALGGDSLTILGFLIEVSERCQTSLPLHMLLRASTITELAELLRRGKISVRSSELMNQAPEIREVEPLDEDQVCALLDEGLSTRMPWRRLFDHPWQHQKVPRGFVMTISDEVVGFVGMICADRNINGKVGAVCNLTSWYVRPANRGWSNALLGAAIDRSDVSFTSLTPGPESRRILEAMGFSAMVGSRLFLPPLQHVVSLLGRRPSLIFDPNLVRNSISDEERRIFDDHIHFGVMPILLKADGATAFLVFRRRFSRRLFPYSEVCHCSAPGLLQRYLEHVKLAVMRRQRTVGLIVGKALLPQAKGVAIPSYTLCRSTLFAAHDLDLLYSEMTLFPL